MSHSFCSISREPERGQTLCSIQAGGEVKLGPTSNRLKLSRRTDGEVGPWQTRCSDGSRRPVPPERERDGLADLTQELSFDGGQESFKKAPWPDLYMSHRPKDSINVCYTIMSRFNGNLPSEGFYWCARTAWPKVT